MRNEKLNRTKSELRSELENIVRVVGVLALVTGFYILPVMLGNYLKEGTPFSKNRYNTSSRYVMGEK